MKDSNNNQYQPAFFIVPSYILSIPNITLCYIKVFETIFQFWNHSKPCYLSLQAISERTNVCKSQICEALKFFEEKGELIRRKKGGRRYLIQPERGFLVDCTETTPESALSDTRVRSSGLAESALADIKNKKLNKEVNITPISPKNISRKKEIPSLSQEQIDSNNPHDIPELLVTEWKSYRDKPITERVWNKTNLVMSQLRESGIQPLKAFEHMLEKLWQGMEYRYFLDEIKAKSREISNQDMNYELGQRGECGF